MRVRLARALRRLAELLDPPARVIERARALHPSARPPRLRPVDEQYVEWHDRSGTRLRLRRLRSGTVAAVRLRRAVDDPTSLAYGREDAALTWRDRP